LSGTLSAGEVIRYNGAEWVDATLTSDDVTADHTGVNYTGALNASVSTHLSGIDSELNNRADTVNSVAVVNGAVTIDSDDIIADRAGVNYTGANTDSLTTHLAAVDTELGNLDNKIDGLDLDALTDVNLSGTLSAGEVIRYNGAEWVDATLTSDDVTADHTGVNYTGALNASVSTHLSGIDTALGDVVESINNVAPQDGNVVLDSDNFTVDRTGVNYTAANTDSLTTHLAAVDTELGNLDGKIDALDLDALTDVVMSGTLSAGEVLRYSGTEWVDATLTSDDVTADHTGVNYTGALNASVSTHLSGIDTELNNRADTVNSVAVVNGAVTIDSDDIIADRAGVNYTGANTDSITTHLAAVDTELNNRADTVNSIAVVNGAVTIDSDDIIADRAGVNYTGANTDSITTHLAAVDTELGNIEGVIAALDLDALTDVVMSGTLSAGEVLRYSGTEWVDATLTSDDVTADHTGVNYTGALNASVSTHLSGIDSELNNRADTVNSVAVVNGAVTIDSDDVVAPHTGVNYTAANTDSITTHLSAIDSALAVAVSNAGLDDLQDVVLSGTLSAGEVLRYSGTEWVDAQLSYNDLSNTPALAETTDDLNSDHTGVNYTGALNATLTTHLSGIDSELNNRADTVNSIAVVNGAVTIDSGDIVATRTGSNYTAANTDSITTHLAAVDTELGNLDGAVAALDLDALTDVTLSGTLSAGEVLRYSGTEWVDAQLSYNDLSNTPALAETTDDLTSDHTGVNYTGALNATLTAHLSGIDTKLGTLAGAGQVEDVTTATSLAKGYLYQSLNTSAVTHTLPATANSDEGDTIRVVRGQSGLVTVEQNGADLSLKVRSSEGFADSYKLNVQGEYVEFVYDADNGVWRVINERSAYIEQVTTTTSNPLAVADVNRLYDLRAFGTGTVTVTLPASSTLKNGDSFRFITLVDRDVELNVAAVDSGNIALYQGGTSQGDQYTVSALAGQAFEVKRTTTGDYLVSGVLGTAALQDVGTSAGNVVQLDSVGRLPAVDGSLLTGIASGGGLSFSRQAADFSANVNFHYSVTTASGAVTATLPALSGVSNGDQVRFYLRERSGTNNLTVARAASTSDTINGSANWVIDVQYDSITLVANTVDAIWEIV
jgi:ribosome assembly protein YihI (activator of Der GTPase)